MDFDEYEYLEKMVEDPEVKVVVNGSEEKKKKKKKDENRTSKHRSDGKENDADYPSKHSKSGEKSRDQDRVGSSRRRSRSRDGERDRHRNDPEQKDREKARDKHRDRDERNGTGGRERYQDPDGERNRRDHDRDGERGRGREPEKEKERFQSFRSRSDRPEGGREDTDRDRNRDKEREKFHDRGFRGDRENRNAGDGYSTSSSDSCGLGYTMRRQKKEERTEQPADPERDQRTVFAYQIHLKADEKDVYEFFTRAGKVRDVHLITDRITKRSKGVGYIEFYDAMSVPMAIALSGQPLRGMPVMVKPSEAEKNLVQPTPAAAGGAAGSVPPGGARKLYVGNLHSDLTSDQLKKIFEPFGEVELVQMPLDQSGNCQGFGFVQFARLEDAQSGLSLNGLEIAGRTIKVSAVTDQPGAQNVAPTSGDFDDDDGGGLTLNASSRAILMQRLDRSGTASSTTGFNGTVGQVYGSAPVVTSAAAPVPAFGGVPFTGLQVPSATAAPTVDPIGVPSGCLLLKNMFDPSLETEPDFDLDIKEDVQEECSKYGKLKHIHVDKNSSGFVYLRFDNTESAVGAQRALHGRWFAGKMITATFMVPPDYESKFPESE